MKVDWHVKYDSTIFLVHIVYEMPSYSINVSSKKFHYCLFRPDDTQKYPVKHVEKLKWFHFREAHPLFAANCICRQF